MAHSLKQTKALLDEVINLLNWQVSSTQNNTAYSQIKNANNLKRAVENLNELGLFPNQVTQLLNSGLYSANGDSIRVTAHVGGQIDALAQSLKQEIETLLTIINMVVTDESPNSINIKLPPVKDFKDLANYSNNLHTALTQVLFLPGVNGNLQIESVENGSIWLNVLLEGEHAMKVIGELVWSAAIIYKTIMEGRKLAADVKAIKNVKQGTIDDVENSQKEIVKESTQHEAELIGSHILLNTDPESIERIKGSIKLLADLLAAGADVRPALNASQEIKIQYPDMKLLPTLESKTKLLQEPSSDDQAV
jgi:hypothetical protein